MTAINILKKDLEKTNKAYIKAVDALADLKEKIKKEKNVGVKTELLERKNGLLATLDLETKHVHALHTYILLEVQYTD